MASVFVWLVIILFILVAAALMTLNKSHRICTYMFFLRFPLWATAILLLFPLVAAFRRPPLISNLFVVTLPGFVIITWLSVYASWAIMYTAGMIYFGAALRNRVPFNRDHAEGDPNKAPTWLLRFRSWIFAALGIPQIITLVLLSDLRWPQELGGILGGVLLAFLTRFILRSALKGRLNQAWASIAPTQVLNSRFLTLFTQPGFSLGTRLREKLHLDDPVHEEFTSKLAAGFFLVTMFVYILGYWFLSPDFLSRIGWNPPALAYLLLMLICGTWFLSTVSYYFDRERIPVLLTVVSTSIILYAAFGSDHYYPLSEPTVVPVEHRDKPLSSTEMLDAWAQRRKPPQGDTMIVVAASGGGISASLWTGRVLTALQTTFPDDFAPSLALVSAVSGGGIGGMYYVSAFDESHLPDSSALDAVRMASGESSLHAWAWGVTYPDFLRALSGGLIPLILWDTDIDRGWAQEVAWQRGLRVDTATLSSWRDDARAGWRPAMIFNATFAETGERFLLGPISLELKETSHQSKFKDKDFWESCPGCDMKLVTAARLSATFPYVSPIARPISKDGLQKPHVADGGYVDNYGVLTILNILREVGPEALVKRGVRRVLLVQIQTSSLTHEETQSSGWLYQVAGPFMTMLNVRESTQFLRNEAEIIGLRELWARGSNPVDLEHVVFYPSCTHPLSWHLSRTEKSALEDEWHSEHNKNAVARIRGLLSATGEHREAMDRSTTR
jgi:hypothetical protein